MAHVITYTNEGGVQPYCAFASGSVVLDVSEDLEVYCGFQPSMIQIFLEDAGGTVNGKVEWFSGIPAGEYLNTADAGDITWGASGGPTVIPESPTETTGAGFTVPTALLDTLGDDDDVLYWIAWR